MKVEGLLLKDTGDGCTVPLKVIPKSSLNKIVGLENGRLKLKVKAPPVEGEANEAVVRFLADLLDVPKNSLSILEGHGSRQKLILVSGRKAFQVMKVLEEQ